MTFSFIKEKRNIPIVLWFLLPALAGYAKWVRGAVNNYDIYKGVFYHLVKQVNLYSQYPQEYFDSNHYGVVFGLIIMPFTWLPDGIGVPLWVALQAFVLYKALQALPIKPAYQWILYLICIVDLMTASHSVQVNPSIAGMLILSWYFVKKEQDYWAVLFVMLGAFVKLYGIVGLAFWVFSRHKLAYIGYGILWAIILFALPMLFSSPSFVIQSYFDWYESLVHKNIENQHIVNGIGQSMQDVSLMGFVRRVGGLPMLSNLFFLVPAVILQGLPLLLFKQYNNTIFQLRYLAAVLIFVVIFSSSSESPTFVIAVSGVAIWFVSQSFPIQRWVWAVLGFVMLGTSLSATDLFPPDVRRMFIIYSIKAVPCCVVWFVCIFQLLFDTTSQKMTLWLNQD